MRPRSKLKEPRTVPEMMPPRFLPARSAVIILSPAETNAIIKIHLVISRLKVGKRARKIPIAIIRIVVLIAAFRKLLILFVKSLIFPFCLIIPIVTYEQTKKHPKRMLMVDDRGLEPLTSSTSKTRSSQLS